MIEAISQRWKDLPVKLKNAVWAEISSSSLLNNTRQIRKIIGPKVSIMGVVKADAYGHGAVAVARTVGDGADYLGVGRLSEAIDLRSNSIDKPILVFGYTPGELLDIVMSLNLTQTVHSFEMAKEYSDRALQLGNRLKIHIKLDTGMGRLGIFLHNISDIESYRRCFSEAALEVEKIARLPGIEIEGIYTHLSSVDIIDIDYAQKQLVTFAEFLNEMENRKIEFKFRHAAGTFAMLNVKDSLFDMVRVGKALYGILPEMPNRPELKFSQALTVKTTVSYIKTVPGEIRVSYAGKGIARKSSVIATIPIGFADGYIWENISSSYVLIHGRKAPIIGRICMDFMMADVTHIDGASLGDEAVITGKQFSEQVLLPELASRFATTPSSIATFLTARTPKIMVE